MTDIAQDIAYLKLTSAEVVTPTATAETLGLWARYEVVNIGTAPTTHDDSITAFVSYHGGVVDHADHRFDAPVVEANGGSHLGTVHVPFEKLHYPGTWELTFQVNRGVGQGISDVVHLPFEVVHPAH